MQTPIDFGKEFLYRLFDKRDVDACLEMLAGDLVWITPEDMHHFLSEGAVLKFLQKQIAGETEPRYVDLVSIKSSPGADNMITVAYEVNLVSREDERPLYLRCSMAICRRGRKREITFLHFSKKSERDSSEQLRDFVTNLPCGVMILACLDGRREEAIYYNDYFAHRLRYRQEEFARAVRKNPFFMASEEDRERIHEEIARARKNGGNIGASLRFYRRDGNCFYYRMKGAPAYQAGGGTVYYCVFQETTGFRMTEDRLQARLDAASEVLRQVPEGICGIEYGPGTDISGLSGFAGDQLKKNIQKADQQIADQQKDDVRKADLQKSDFQKENDPKADLQKTDYRKDDVRKADLQRENDRKEDLRKEGRTSARVIYMSRNIPSLFGVSNSAYSRNIVTDPFFGLEMTSITRSRLLGSDLFKAGKAGQGASRSSRASCGIYRLRRPDGESLRVELEVRRVQDKDGTVRLYLFYHDREAQQLELEDRVDRAMKMGRAAQDQLRTELRKAKEGAARRQSELSGELRAAGEKHEAEISRMEQQLLEEKNRSVLMSRQLEESRATQRQMAEELEKAQADAGRRVRNIRDRAERKIEEARAEAQSVVKKAEEAAGHRVREAEEKVRKAEETARIRAGEAEKSFRREEEAARSRADEAERIAREAAAAKALLEEQLREAQERARLLESRLKSEEARRRLLESQIGEDEGPVSRLLNQPAEYHESPVSAILQDAPAVMAAETGRMTAAASGAALSAGQAGPAVFYHGQGQESPQTLQTLQPLRPGDWMTTGEPLTVFSAMDLAPKPGSENAADPVTKPGPGAEADPDPVPAAEIVGALASKNDFGAEAESTPKPVSETVAEHASKNASGLEAVPAPYPASGLKADSEPEAVSGSEAVSAPTDTGTGKPEEARKAVKSGREVTAVWTAEPGEGVLQEEVFSPLEVLESALAKTEIMCRDRGITLRTYRDSRLPDRVSGFAEMLQRGLCELLENAVNRSGPGGLVSIHSRADRPAGGLVNLYIRIDDSGPVISEDRMQKLFEPEAGSNGAAGKSDAPAEPDREAAAGKPHASAEPDPETAERVEAAAETGPEEEPAAAGPGLVCAMEAAGLMGGSIYARSGRRGNRFAMTVTVRTR